MSLEAFIRAEAGRLGFAAAGIAAAGPSVTGARFRRWLDSGFAGGMEYLARHADLRDDPRRLMPGARALIVAAARYPGDKVPQPYAALARAGDYHAVLRDKLRRLARALADVPGAPREPLRWRACVDSAPLAEREWAVRAGLGWIGRQGSLVHPRWGCTLVLGSLLVNWDLAPDVPLANGCGTCRRCLAACPAGAIRPGAVVDARRCIAYLTVEHRGEIPAARRPALGGALFGCDRCTAVCPFNPEPADGVLPELAPAGVRPDAAACLALGPVEFARVFRGTTVYRSGLDRLRRNARLALAASPSV